MQPVCATQKSARARLRRWASRISLLALSTLAALALSEAGLRLLLFSDLAIAQRLGAPLRSPNLYADRSDSTSWKLRYRWRPPERRGSSSPHDEQLGWRPPLVDARTRRHSDSELLAGRRPVLLFGDSFARCVTGEGDGWQGLFDRSALGSELVLLNHGDYGYGLDQIFLAYMGSIEAYAELDPIVVIGILVDDDLDRCTLDFRGRPKPRLELDEQGRLVLPSGPTADDPEDYIQRTGIGIRSYLWRLLSHSTPLVPEAWSGRQQGRWSRAEEMRGLTRAILDALAADLRARKLSFLFWVFSGSKSLDPDRPDDWREPFLIAELERRALPYLRSRQPLEAYAAGEPGRLWDCFLADGHLNVLGNAVAFAPLLAELERLHFGATAAQPARPPEPLTDVAPELARLRLPDALVEEMECGEAGWVRQMTDPARGVDQAGGARRLLLRADPKGESSLTYRVLRPVASFSATLLVVRGGAAAAEAPAATVIAEVDGVEVQRFELAASSAPTRLQIPLEGAQRLSLRLRAASPDGGAATCCLSAPAFHVARPR